MTQLDRYRAEQRAFRVLLAAADDRQAACAGHPVPPPRPHRFYPDQMQMFTACSCYLDSPEVHAMMAWRSNFCEVCGAEGKCLPTCDAMDARR